MISLVSAFVANNRAFLGPHSAAQVGYYHRCNSFPQLSAEFSSSRDASQQAAIFAREEETRDEKKQIWRNVPIISSRPACPSGKSTLIEIQVNAKMRQEYTTPGQFIQLRPNNDDATIDPIFLAMASAPTASSGSDESTETFQFLVKMSPRLPWLPESLVEGSTVQISPVIGSGFPLHKLPAATNDDLSSFSIVLAAAGTGIAPLKACIESGLLPASPSTILYYGEWTHEDLCFTDVYDTWKHEYGVHVEPALSRTPDSQGYIQEILSSKTSDDDGNHQHPSSPPAWAILCGMDDMVESCTQVLKEKGVPEDHILLNL